MFDGVELYEALQDDDGSWLSVVSGPTAEAGEDPSGVGERACWVWIFLSLGFAFEDCRDGFDGGLILGIDGVLERAAGGSVAFSDELEHADGGDQAGGDELFEGPAFGEAQGLDVEALGLEGPEQLLDDPALAVEGDDAAGVGEIGDVAGGPQAPVGGGLTGRRRRLHGLDQIEADGGRQGADVGGALAAGRAGDVDLAEAQGERDLAARSATGARRRPTSPSWRRISVSAA